MFSHSKNKKMKTLFAVSLTCSALFILVGCGGGEKKKEDQGGDKKDKKELKHMEMLHLGEHGLPLKLMVPEENVKKQVPPPEVEFNPSTSKMRIRVGESFQLSLKQVDPRPIEDVKADLKNLQQAYEFKFLKESNDMLLYRKVIPNSDLKYFHFYKVKEVDGKPYVVRSLKEGEFTRKQVERMLDAVGTMEKAAMPKKKEAA